jgi:antitoxin HigA-1
MPVKTPPHPGRLVKDEIGALGLSAGRPAQGLGVTRQQLYRVIKGECAISPEMAVRLEKGVGSSAAAWLRMQMNYDLAKLRERSATIAVTRLTPDVTDRA